MPVNDYGQLITFSIERGSDQNFSGYSHVRVTKRLDTCRKIAAWRGQPDMARRIADLNGIRSVTKKLKVGRSIRVPDRLRRSASFSALSGDEPPRITGGYAKIESVDRPLRAGMSVFTGYDPTTMEVALRFEAWLTGEGLLMERDIDLLEQMAGRGNIGGQGVGSPPLVQVSTTNPIGHIVPLIPAGYQWTREGHNAPLWWVSGLDWGTGALRDDDGNRVRADCTVTLTEYNRPRALTRR